MTHYTNNGIPLCMLCNKPTNQIELTQFWTSNRKLVELCGKCSVQQQPKPSVIMLPVLRCERCSHSWIPRTTSQPKTCPNKKCKSPYWNRKRKA